jgi:RNA polymerase sigma-70 factor (ECF subfamily)
MLGLTLALAEGTDPLGDSLDPAGWVDRHGDVLYRFALARLRNGELAENCVQEAFLAALAARDTFSGRSSERTWLVGILKRKVYDHFRATAREAPAEDPDAELGPAPDLFDDRGRWKVGPAEWGSPEGALTKAEFRAVLAACMEALPGRLRDSFTMREMDDMDTGELCKVLGVTETNLWVMLHRARTRLRQCLEENWFGKGGQE